MSICDVENFTVSDVAFLSFRPRIPGPCFTSGELEPTSSIRIAAVTVWVEHGASLAQQWQGKVCTTTKHSQLLI